MTAQELLKELTDKKRNLKAQINSLEEEKSIVIFNDDDHSYYKIAAELGDLEYYYEQLVIAIDIIKDFIKEV